MLIRRRTVWIMMSFLLVACAAGARAGVTAPALYPDLEDLATFNHLVEGVPPTGLTSGEGVKGIYVTGYVASSLALVRPLLALAARTEINAMVVDVKDVTGLTYRSQIPGAPRSRELITDLEALVDFVKQEGLYTIARLCVFHDTDLAQARPDLAIQTVGGGIWRDFAGGSWTDPYLQEVWDYNVAVAMEVAALGFDEVQFDYIRFPTDGDLGRAVHADSRGLSRVEAVNGFLRQARAALRPYGVPISADVFGLVCYVDRDTGLGQLLEEIMEVVDYLSPMVYPSHYHAGSFGLPDPDQAPYETVYESLRHARLRLSPEDYARIRPWLQDFTLRHRYGPEEVRAQIRAAEESGLTGWLLWNARNRYTPSALRPAD